jgi:HEAT repeat protein
MPPGVRIRRVSSAIALATLPGCRAAPPEISFQAPTPQARAAAVARAATEQDPDSIPDLIESLDDDDPVIRSWAIRGLEDITGQTLGYDPFAPQGLRDEAVERWVRWRRASAEADIVDEEAAGRDDPAPAPDPHP